MKHSHFRILLVGTFNESFSDLIPVLKRNDYIVDSAMNIEKALQIITDEETDLVVSSNKLNGFYGFEFYNQMKKSLIRAGVPFLMALDDFEKEDILIGLEMGIDNYLFSPFNETVVMDTIEIELKKRKDPNLFETNGFKHYFITTSVAMFFKSKGRICLVNEAFSRLTGVCSTDVEGIRVEELFQLVENESNRMNYHRFKIGAASESHLKNVQYINNGKARFDISFYRGKTDGVNAVFAELVPSFLDVHAESQNSVNLTSDSLNGKEPNTYLSENEGFRYSKLTGREQEVFKLSACGLPIKVIAAELNISERTVEKHRANIMSKTNSRNMIEAIIQIQKN